MANQMCFHSKIESAALADWFAEPPNHERRKWELLDDERTCRDTFLFDVCDRLLISRLPCVFCDLRSLEASTSIFPNPGTNTLLGYVLHDMVGSELQPFAPKDSPAWYAYGSLGFFPF